MAKSSGGGTPSKKRGVTGKSKAESNPYRLNGGGLFPLYMRSILGSDLSRRIGRPPLPRAKQG